jgi:hypothetical protein
VNRDSRDLLAEFNAHGVEYLVGGVDLLGALGELFLLSTIMGAAGSDRAVAYMRDHLSRQQGGRGVKGPDLHFTDDETGALHEIDVKTFDCSPNKKFFAINDNKHRLLAGQCSAYFCIVTHPSIPSYSGSCL